MYTVNEDGTVTRNGDSFTSSSPQPSGSSDDNPGCWGGFLVLFVIGVVIYALVCNNEKSINQETSAEPAYQEIIDSVSEEYDDNDVVNLSISATSVLFDADGGYYTFSIDCNSSWIISTDTYEWGHLSKSGNQLALRIEPNPSMESRTDYFEISSGSETIRVDISQEGKEDIGEFSSSNVSGTIRNVWVEHNVSNSNGNKGMRIHVNFDINGMLNRRGQAVAYFYFSSGNPLKDTNGLCCTSNGNVATHVDFTPNYENSNYNDLLIFMPYSELHLDKSASCFFTVSIWAGSKEVEQSDKTYFDFEVE